MKEKLKNLWKSKKGKWIIVSLSVLVILGLGIFALAKNKDPLASYDLATVEKGDIVEKVEVTGKVVPAREVNLTIPQSGRIASVNVKNGSHVSTGTVLASIENGDLRAELAQAEINLEKQTIIYNQLLRANQNGNNTSQNNVSSDEAAVINARKDYEESLKEGYEKTDNAVSTYIDHLFTDPRTSPRFGVTVTENNTTYNVQGFAKENSNINASKQKTNDLLENWKEEINNLTANNLSRTSEIAADTTEALNSLLQDISSVLNSYQPRTTTEESLYSGLKADIYATRNIIREVNTSINSASQAMFTIKSEVNPDELKLEELSLRDAKTNVEAIRANLSETMVHAPFSGTITSVDAKVGETASSNTSLISLMSDGQYEIEAYVPESDIAKIKIGNPAEITLDAYGQDEKFEAKVITLDPRETLLEGVSTYRIVLSFTKNDSRIRGGMTANIEIETGSRKDVIRIPQRAIIENDGVRFVKVVLENNTVEEKPVKTGMRGSDGYVEIISGVNEGNRIVAFDKSEK